MSEPEPLEVRGLVKRYGTLTAVAGVDVTVRAGDVYGYLGPNGAGKTTSLRMMLGFTADDTAVAELSQALVEAGALIKALAPQSATLEDLFFSLTEDGHGAEALPAQPAEAVQSVL